MEKIKESHIKYLCLLLLLGLGLGIHLLLPDFYSTIWRLSLDGDLKGAISYLQSFGYWAIVVSIIIDVSINIVGFLPSIFISTANGVVFGIVPGIIISWFAETLGVVISFWCMRVLFRKSAEELIKKSRMLTKLDSYSNFGTMMIARAVPYSPNGLVTALGALSSISYKDYTLACLVGKFPSVAIEVLVGYDLVYYQQNSGRLMWIVTAVVVVYGALWLWKRHKESKKV